MKAKLMPNYTEKQVREYWHSINAPIYLRKLITSSEEFSIGKRPDRHSEEANIFLLQSANIPPLNRDSMIRKIIIDAKERGIRFKIDDDIPSPMVVLNNIRGKML